MASNDAATKETSTSAPQDAPYNIFRDSLLRYAGYANEVGESFRYQFPKLVVPSYMVSFGYCLSDAAHTGYNEYHGTNRNTTVAALSSMDVLVWQSLASVMIPGATINLIVRSCRLLVQRAPLPAVAVQWLPTAVGLSSIPFIIHPIDDFVDTVLDATMRPYLKQWKEGQSKQCE